MMLARIANEALVLRRHPMIWAAIAGVVVFSAAAVRSAPTDPEDGVAAALLWLNILFPMFILPFFAGALAPIFYLREVDHQMGEIVGSYPITPRSWMAVRVISFTLIMLFASLLSQLLNIVLLSVEFPGETGTLLIDAFKWLLVLQLPNCLLWASILGWVASRKAHSGVLYFTAAMLWLGYNALASITGSWLIAGSIVLFEPLQQAMFLLDPYAATSLLGATPEEGLLQWRELNVAVGRLFLLSVVALLLHGIRTVPMLAERKVDKLAKKAPTFGTSWPTQLDIHLRYAIRDKVFPLLILGWFALILPEIIGSSEWVEPLSRVAPDSRDALNRVAWDILIGAGTLLMLYTADRVCRLYSSTRMQELYAATPHRPVRLVAMQLAAVLLVALFHLALAAVAVAAGQCVIGSPVDPSEYTLQLGVLFSQLVIFAAFFVGFHGLIRQRFIANLAGLATIVLAFSPLLTLIGLVNPLWQPVSTPIMPPDHVWGFGGGLAGHWQFSVYWGAIALAAILVAVASHHRSLPFASRRWAKAIRHPAMALAVTTLVAAGLQGASIAGTLEAEGAFQTTEERYAWRAAYERNFASWADVAQPDVEKITAYVDFIPSEQRANIHAELTLINRLNEPIELVLVGRNQLGVPMRFNLDGASVETRDAVAQQTVFALNRPLAPGARTTLEVEMTLAQSNLMRASFPFTLRPDFNTIPAYAMLPVVGFRKEIILRSPENRENQGLPPINITPPSLLDDSIPGRIEADRVMVEAIITTAAGHHAVGQGELLRSWQEDGRALFHYRTAQPIRALPAFYSVPSKPQRFAIDDVDLEFYAPAQVDADNPNILGMRDAFDLLNREVALYQGERLALIVTPEIGPTGFALPQMMQVSHKVAIRAFPREDSGFSQVYRRAAHETAHQWFGHMIGHGVPEDRAFLIESLAKYVELVVIERRFGVEAMQALVDYERDRYRNAQINLSADVEPLIDATENHDQYSRASIVFACLRQQVGDAPILAAARSLVRDEGRATISRDFVVALVEQSDTSDHETIERLLTGTEPVLDLLENYRCQKPEMS